MSIIYDALKKTQDNRSPATRFSSLKERLFDVILLIAIMLLIFFIIFLYYQHHHTTPKYFAQTNKTPIKTMAGSTLQKPVVTQLHIPFNGEVFKMKHPLKGVFISEQEKVAMIDNQFFHEGDEVDGMKIISMDAEKIKLKNTSGVVVLRVG